MKNYLTKGIISFVLLVSSFAVMAQEEKESPFSATADIVSSYVWRGTLFSGASFQPGMKATFGGLTIGGWGSWDFAGTFAESDLFISYSFDFGLSLGVTDYYYPGLKYTDLSDTAGAHAFEINAGYTFKGLSVSGNYIINEAGGAASMGGDVYFEAKYAFSNFSAFVGAGNGWHTIDEDPEKDEFGVVNVGFSASKSIKFSDSFSLPIGGSLIWNPQAEQFFVVGTISF